MGNSCLHHSELNLGECIFMDDMGNCIDRNNETDPCPMDAEENEEDDTNLCADCGDKAHEFYDDEWLCLDCIVKRDFEEHMQKRMQNARDHQMPGK